MTVCQGSLQVFRHALTSVRGGGRVGVFEIEAFYSRFIGMEQPPKSLMRWLHLPEDKLAAVVGRGSI